MSSSTHHRVYSNLYKDSVALMAISSQLQKMGGIDAASVVMATPANRENLEHAGLTDDAEAGPNDVLVAVRGEDTACEQALDQADRLLAEQPSADSGAGGEAEQPPSSIRAALRRDASSNLALISVPGRYAGAEALKALRSGLHVMIFSDNVPVETELEAKRYAAEHDLLVMGPDCGTALVNGVPLGFANVVRRGRIGVVGASGTGMQEITCRIHQLGEGVSQALGTGGHDLSEQVGGISTVQALLALDADESTQVIVLVSKPPARRVAEKVLGVVEKLSTAAVVVFVGADASTAHPTRITFAGTLAGAAERAVAVLRGAPVEPEPTILPEKVQERLAGLVARQKPGQRYLRGIFSGGTFCYEAQQLCRSAGITAHSNTPVAGNPELDDIWGSLEHTIIDMGDDEFTRGRPHPMIDPTLRNDRLLAEAGDPGTAVLLFDVVLGYGAAADPIPSLLDVLERCRAICAADGRFLIVVVHVCGTDDDPQRRSAVVAALQEADVIVAGSNAEAARMAAFVITHVDSPQLVTSGKE